MSDACWDFSRPADFRAGDLWLVNKLDSAPEGFSLPAGALGISVQTGAGMSELLSDLSERVVEAYGLSGSALMTRERHRVEVSACADHVARAIRGLEDGIAAELVAEELRLAARALGRLTGRVDVEELLDLVFRDFCIGK